MNTTTAGAQTQESIEFTRVNSDANGNPRYVCHFLAFLNEQDRKARRGFDLGYDVALNKARELGGKKFHNKQYGGGIVFQMYGGQQVEMSQRITEIKNRTLKFKTDWSKEDFKKMHKAILRHFKNKMMNTRTGAFFCNNYKEIDELLGLAYTSSGVHACYSICNTELTYDSTDKYEFFIMSEDGTPYAELWDKNENEKYIKL